MALPMTWGHEASVLLGKFRRAWVASELTEQNWDRSGLVYRDAVDGAPVYATVQRVTRGDDTAWRIRRHRYPGGRLQAGAFDDHLTLGAALEALGAEAQASRERFGSVPPEEWPEDADNPWIVFSIPRRSQP